jgi:hypothetical protein
MNDAILNVVCEADMRSFGVLARALRPVMQQHCRVSVCWMLQLVSSLTISGSGASIT